MASPVLAVINVGDLTSIKDLFGSDVSPSTTQQLLHIHCKYYRTDVVLREIDKEQDLKGSEAVLIYFDASKESSWQDAQRWMSTVDELELPLRLLVCTRVPFETQSDSGLSQIVVPCFRRLAIEREFELIELDPHEDNVEEGEEFGVQRIKSALESHMWSNMELLDQSIRPSLLASMNITSDRSDYSTAMSSTALPNHSSCAEPAQPSHIVEVQPSNANGETAKKLTTEEPLDLSDEQSIDSFERAFRAIMTTRDRVSQLDHAARRKLAEKLTFQLWRAVGGSPDEIDGLTDDSSDDE